MSALALAVLLLRGPVQGDGASLADDPNLKTAVSLSVRNTAVSDVLKEISKKTHSSLSATKLVADRKVTVFVDDLPASKLLEKIADVLMLQWRSQRNGFEITQASEIGNYRSNFITREDVLLHEDAMKQVKLYTQYASIPYDQLIQRKNALEAAQNPNDRSYTTNPAARQRIAKELTAVNTAADPANYAVGLALQNTSAASLWQQAVRVQRLPATAPAAPPRFNNFGNQGPQYVFVRYSAVKRQLEIAGNGRQPSAEYQVSHQNVMQVLATTALGKLNTAWAQIMTPTKRESYDQPVASGGRGVMAAEILQAVHDATKVQVIAEGSRQMLEVEAKGDSLVDFARNFVERSQGFIRLEGDILEFRHPSFWRLPSNEVPESKLQALEKISDEGKLTLATYATFVAGLDRAQIDALSTGKVRMSFPIEPIQRAWPGLALYGLLTAPQRNIVYSGTLAYGQLTQKQKEAANEAILLAAFMQPQFGMQGLNRLIEYSANPNFLENMGITLRMSGGADSNTGMELSAIGIGDGETTVSYRVPLPIILPGG